MCSWIVFFYFYIEFDYYFLDWNWTIIFLSWSFIFIFEFPISLWATNIYKHTQGLITTKAILTEAWRQPIKYTYKKFWGRRSIIKALTQAVRSKKNLVIFPFNLNKCMQSPSPPSWSNHPRPLASFTPTLSTSIHQSRKHIASPVATQNFVIAGWRYLTIRVVCWSRNEVTRRKLWAWRRHSWHTDSWSDCTS